MSDPIRNRYQGRGGLYVVVDGEVFPADEQGTALPHTLNEDGALVPPPPPVVARPAVGAKE